MTDREWDAATYDRIADPMTRWGAVVLDRLPLRGDERVLDAGCGTGRVTELLLERVPDGHVVALDASSRMLTEAGKRLGRFGARVELVHADLLEPIPTDPVDAVVSTATLHWIDDHDALFRNIATVLRPGGRLAAQDYVERRASKGDGRQAEVYLTERGRRAIDTIDKVWKRVEKTALDGIDDKDRKRLRKLLRQIERNLGGKRTGRAPADDEDIEAGDELAAT